MTRDDILEAAAQIFSQKGYHGTSMQDIAEAVSLQKASLYHHVSSKQEILVAILDQALDLLIENMQQVMGSSAPADEKLCQAMQVYLKSMLEHRDLAAVLLLEHRSLDLQAQAHHIPKRDRFEKLWRDLIEEGVAEGLLSTSDIEMATRALLGVLNWTITWYRPEGRLSPEEIAGQYGNLFLSGLGVRRR